MKHQLAFVVVEHVHFFNVRELILFVNKFLTDKI